MALRRRIWQPGVRHSESRSGQFAKISRGLSARAICRVPPMQTVSKRPRETRDRLEGLEAQFGSGEGDDKARTGFLPSGHVERDAVNDVVVAARVHGRQ